MKQKENTTKEEIIQESTITEKKKMPKENRAVTQEKSSRILSIDRFRGLCMFVMVISFFLGAFGETFLGWGPIFEHGANGFQILPGVAFADIFAPMFIFVIGLTYVKSFKSREAKYGTKRAYFQIATRYLGLMGIGALLNGFEDGWLDVFQGKAFAGLDTNIKIFAVGFFIAIALVLLVVISRFVKNDKFKTVASCMLRYFLALMGLFVLYFIIVSTGEQVGNRFDGSFTGNRYGGWIWDTLQNIGLAGLLALPFVKFNKWGKFTMVAIAFTAMTIFVQNGGFFLAQTILEGGLLGGISWAGILLLGCVFIEIKDDKKYWVIAALMLLISIILIVAFGFTAAKRGATPVYALFCASISAIVFAGIDALNRFQIPKFAFFSWWGGSALLTYTVNYLVCLVLGIILEVTSAVLPIWAALLITVAFLVLYTVMNWLLYRKEKHIRL